MSACIFGKWLTIRHRRSACSLPPTKKIGQNPKIGQLWRPVAPQPYVVQKSWADRGSSLAFGLQCGVNSICLQCIPWPTCDFRFSGSGIRTMIRIGLKSWSVDQFVVHVPTPCRHAKFHPNPCTRLWVILLTDRQTDQTDKHRGQSHSPPPLLEVINTIWYTPMSS